MVLFSIAPILFYNGRARYTRTDTHTCTRTQTHTRSHTNRSKTRLNFHQYFPKTIITELDEITIIIITTIYDNFIKHYATSKGESYLGAPLFRLLLALTVPIYHTYTEMKEEKKTSSHFHTFTLHYEYYSLYGFMMISILMYLAKLL